MTSCCCLQQCRHASTAAPSPCPRAAAACPPPPDTYCGRFLQTRAAHIAQTSLYGYLRTRAGTRFPELFDDDTFVHSVNIAKWHVWLACLSDLAVYAGGMLAAGGQLRHDDIGALMRATLEAVLRETGVPADAGPEYGAHAERVRARVALCHWRAIPDDETAFSESPAALVYWAPVVDELKALDEEIVRNSIRFRWREVRQELRRDLDTTALAAAAQPPA
jgi:hypothetical protein